MFLATVAWEDVFLDCFCYSGRGVFCNGNGVSGNDEQCFLHGLSGCCCWCCWCWCCFLFYFCYLYYLYYLYRALLCAPSSITRSPHWFLILLGPIKTTCPAPERSAQQAAATTGITGTTGSRGTTWNRRNRNKRNNLLPTTFYLRPTTYHLLPPLLPANRCKKNTDNKTVANYHRGAVAKKTPVAKKHKQRHLEIHLLLFSKNSPKNQKNIASWVPGKIGRLARARFTRIKKRLIC